MANSDGRLSSDAEAAGQTLPPTSIRAQLTRILQSQTFCNAPSLSRFLEFLVEKALEGKRDYLKEYSLGVEVFDRGPSFDPRTDTIVRVQARRLRAKLQDYYASEGRADPLVVELPKGHYVPLFRRTCVPEPGALVIPEARSEADLVGSSAPNGAVPNLNGRWASPVRYRAHLAAALVLAGTALAYFAGIRGSPTKSPSWTIRPLTSYSGHEGHASFSPDGSLVTFSYTARGNFDIHVRPVTGGDPIALTNHPADDTMPTWSPDGRYIAFLSDRGRGAYVFGVARGRR